MRPLRTALVAGCVGGIAVPLLIVGLYQPLRTGWLPPGVFIAWWRVLHAVRYAAWPGLLPDTAPIYTGPQILMGAIRNGVIWAAVGALLEVLRSRARPLYWLASAVLLVWAILLGYAGLTMPMIFGTST